MPVTLSGSGQVPVQVVSAAKTDTFSTTSQAFVDVPGLSVNITPSSSSNKILINMSVSWSATAHSDIRILRNGTVIAVGDAAGSRVQSTNHVYLGWTNGIYTQQIANMMWVDSPATTSSVNYKIQIANPYSSGYTTVVNRSAVDDNFSYEGRTVSSITAMEISG